MGAPQARLSELAQGLIRHGYRVTVLTAMPNYPQGKIFLGYKGFFKREKVAGVNVLRAFIYPTKKPSFIPRLLSYFSFVLSSLIVGLFHLRSVDYLLTESPPLFLGISGYLLSRLKKARWIFNASDLWPESAVHLGVVSEGLALSLSYKLEAFFYRHVWLVTGQSKTIIKSIKDRFPQVSTYHLSNGVDPDKFKPNIAKFTPPAEWLGKTVFIYAGLHGIAQGLDQIILAVTTVAHLENCLFVLVGDGPEKESLIQQANAAEIKNIQFLPPLPKEQIISMLSVADVSLVPLKLNLPGAVPSKLYEGMASRKPVILIAEGEAAEIVSQANTGIVVKPGDMDGLVKAIESFANNPDFRQQLGLNGRKLVETSYNRQVIIDEFVYHISNAK
ncbi:MAG: glycosyltransferase WbuB [Chloroflexi bacterium HGW-Chloroflexi-3]|nr:MAG: glycosyltransferase WbuB [Chloroflexi bacterium HGW-Chloroflexi-3]